MSKRQKFSGDADGGTAVLEAPAPAALSATALPETGPYTINFRWIDSGGNDRAHAWLPWCITLEGCTSADDARKKLHQAIDEAIYRVEAARY